MRQPKAADETAKINFFISKISCFRDLTQNRTESGSGILDCNNYAFSRLANFSISFFLSEARKADRQFHVVAGSLTPQDKAFAIFSVLNMCARENRTGVVELGLRRAYLVRCERAKFVITRWPSWRLRIPNRLCRSLLIAYTALLEKFRDSVRVVVGFAGVQIFRLLDLRLAAQCCDRVAALLGGRASRK